MKTDIDPTVEVRQLKDRQRSQEVRAQRKGNIGTGTPDEKLKIDGVVIDTLPDTKFRVKLSDGREIFAYLSGKMRMNYIKVTVGDKVTVELSPDGNKGRITYRR